VRLKRIYRNRWMEKKVKVPALSSGVYVISARGGVEDRTWLPVSSRARSGTTGLCSSSTTCGGRTIEYVLRTEAPGRYSILPSVASLMYFPEVRGRGKLVRMPVIEER